MKNIRFFFSENFSFLVVKFSIYLYRHVFVMCCGFCLVFVIFAVLWLCLKDPVYHCDRLVWEEGAGCFSFLRFVACILSAMVCWLLLLVSYVGYVL